jgi:hypothetical protein
VTGEKFSPKRLPVRRTLRALHRDVGYLAVGLTIIYALSGLAINHIADWDPNFTAVNQVISFPQELPTDLRFVPEDAAGAKKEARRILKALGRTEEMTDAYALDERHLDITLKHTTLYVSAESRTIREEGQKPRWLLRAANWLHLNRGKKAWTYIADGYAVFLLFLATSGLFMLPGKRGLLGRGAVLALVGALVPILYVTLSGGP